MAPAASRVAVLAMAAKAVSAFGLDDPNVLVQFQGSVRKAKKQENKCWKLCNSNQDGVTERLLANNLGGAGPANSDDSEIRYKDIYAGELNRRVDLIVTVNKDSEYHAWNAAVNGQHKCFGVVNLKSTKSVTLDFNLVEVTYSRGATLGQARKTEEKPFISDFPVPFAVFDIDQSAVVGQDERVTFEGTQPLSEGREIGKDLHEVRDGGHEFSVVSQSFGNSADNPLDAWDHWAPLTEDQQRARAVRVHYTPGTSKWSVTFGTDGGNRGRNFFFASGCETSEYSSAEALVGSDEDEDDEDDEKTLEDVSDSQNVSHGQNVSHQHKASHQHKHKASHGHSERAKICWKPCHSNDDGMQSELVANNLGGAGPMEGEEVIRYSKIFHHDGKPVDLIVRTADDSAPYHPWNPEQNGQHKCFGSVNVPHNSSVKLRFSMVHHETTQVMRFDKPIGFTVLDVDHSNIPGQLERVVLDSAHANGEHTIVGGGLSEDSVEDARDAGHLRLTAGTFGNRDDNPMDANGAWAPLSEADQRARSVEVEYKAGTSEWEATFESIGGNAGRNFFFFGCEYDDA